MEVCYFCSDIRIHSLSKTLVIMFISHDNMISDVTENNTAYYSMTITILVSESQYKGKLGTTQDYTHIKICGIRRM